MVVAGINSGPNLGDDVLYSGTVAAAIEGAFFGITSIAVSLEFDEQAQYEKAAAIAGMRDTMANKRYQRWGAVTER